MSIDVRTRRFVDVRDLSVEEVIDEVLPSAIAAHGDLAARGISSWELAPLGIDTGVRPVTVLGRSGDLVVEPGVDAAGVIVELDNAALSDLIQDRVSSMGLAMTSRLRVTRGSLDEWVDWEPALRALLDGRPVHETGDIGFDDGTGGDLDLARSFTLDDDRDEIRHFLEEAGFLHLRGVFDEAEMVTVGDDIDEWLARATPDDGESWWAEDAHGEHQPVRVLWFHEKSDALAELVADERLRWLADLTGDDLDADSMGAEGLVKPLDIVKGLSDLPWHKDCGQGQHSYRCSGITIGISVTGADRRCGALGVIPGSHRANTTVSGRNRRLDLEPRVLETVTGDLTVHCSDTLHRAHPPLDRPRKVVYTSMALRPLPGDTPPVTPREQARRARADLTDVTDRIEAADNAETETRYRARRPD